MIYFQNYYEVTLSQSRGLYQRWQSNRVTPVAGRGATGSFSAHAEAPLKILIDAGLTYNEGIETIPQNTKEPGDAGCCPSKQDGTEQTEGERNF